jgi:hypothetical protein
LEALLADPPTRARLGESARWLATRQGTVEGYADALAAHLQQAASLWPGLRAAWEGR